MIRNHFFTGLILIIITVFLGYRVYKVWMWSFDMPVQAIQQYKIDKKQPEAKKEIVLNKEIYNVVVQKDLFRPSRTAPPVKDKILLPQEKPKLFGTVVMNDKKSAILEDPLTRTSRLYNINDSVAGFVISDIQEDKVILLMGSEKIEIRLRDVKDIQQYGPPIQSTQPEQQIQRPTPDSTRRPPLPRRRNLPPPPQVGRPTTPEHPEVIPPPEINREEVPIEEIE